MVLGMLGRYHRYHHEVVVVDFPPRQKTTTTVGDGRYVGSMQYGYQLRAGDVVV